VVALPSLPNLIPIASVIVRFEPGAGVAIVIVAAEFIVVEPLASMLNDPTDIPSHLVVI
jgi:hypothetical protein